MFLLFLLFLSIFTPVLCMENSKTIGQSPQKASIVGAKFCDNCYKKETLERFNKCSKCHNVSYCSVDCQKNDWRVRHKQECGKEFDRATRNDEIKKLRKTLVQVIEERSADIQPASSSGAYEKLDEHGTLYRMYLNEMLKSAFIKKDNPEFDIHAALLAATMTEPLLQIFPIDPILLEIHKLTIYPDILFSRLVKNKTPMPEEKNNVKLATSFFKVFETTRAQSKKLTTLGYPDEAVNALQILRRNAIHTIVAAFFQTKQTLSVEEMLSIWAYKLFVTLPCLYVNKVEQLVSCLNKEVMNEQCIIELFDCIKHDVVLTHSIENDTDWTNFTPVSLSRFRNQLNKNFKQKSIDATSIRSLAQSLSTLSPAAKILHIAMNERSLFSGLLCSLYL